MRLSIIAGQAGSGKTTAAEILSRRFGVQPIGMAEPLKTLAQGAFDFTREQLHGPSAARNAPDPRYEPGSVHWDITSRAIRGDVGEVWLVEHFPSYRDEVEFAMLHGSLYRWFRALRFACETSGDVLSPRRMLQTLGTDWGRRHIGENVWIDAAIARARRMGGEVLITDGRFPNEIARVKAAGGRAIRLIDPDAAQLVGDAATHTSETELQNVPADLFDAAIVNDKTRGLDAFERSLCNAFADLPPL